MARSWTEFRRSWDTPARPWTSPVRAGSPPFSSIRPPRAAWGSHLDPWTPGTRTLSTTTLPAGATRLEAWREGSGGMPEMLAGGLPGETSITLPKTITFHTREPYQLWLQARNPRGSSTPGPVQNWTAP